jgi:predicted transposase YbfD/YdcC
VVSAWAVERGVALGQVATDSKSNEITAIPELLDTIDVKGATVTIDAMGTQREIAAKIVDQGGAYVLALKGNHPLLHQEVVEYFEHAQQDRTIDARPPQMHEVVDKAHGRLEVRRTFCTDDLDWMTERTRWKGLKSIVMVERERTVGDATTLEKAYYLTTRDPDAQRLGEIVRRHWSIENELHWVLDMTCDEDHSRVVTAAPLTSRTQRSAAERRRLRRRRGPIAGFVRLHSVASKQAADHLSGREGAMAAR